MPSPNRNIELSVADMEMIEEALRARTSEKVLEDNSCPEARRLHDLLGRLHNQKVFFRPASQTYIGG